MIRVVIVIVVGVILCVSVVVFVVRCLAETLIVDVP